MQVSQFTSLLENPSQINTEKQVRDLEEILENYPFFQAARGMHLLGLKNTNSYQYNAALKKHAAYTTDRSWLFEIITADAFNEPVETVGGNELVAQEDLAITEEDTNLDLGRPLVFGKNDRHSFEEWLSLTSDTVTATSNHIDKGSSNKSEGSSAASQPKAAKMAQIDAFLAKNPKIDAHKEITEQIDIKEASTFNKEALMTETLARVYLEQKKYKKALQAYKILSLKYPEKNSFFASQIKSVKKLIKDKS